MLGFWRPVLMKRFAMESLQSRNRKKPVVRPIISTGISWIPWLRRLLKREILNQLLTWAKQALEIAPAAKKYLQTAVTVIRKEQTVPKPSWKECGRRDSRDLGRAVAYSLYLRVALPLKYSQLFPAF